MNIAGQPILSFGTPRPTLSNLNAFWSGLLRICQPPKQQATGKGSSMKSRSSDFRGVALRAGNLHRAICVGEARSDLRVVRDGALTCRVPEILLETNASSTDIDGSEETFETRHRNFEAKTGVIRSGNHTGWLDWISHVYLGMFNDVDENATPLERLATLLGEDHAEIAIEGLIAARSERMCRRSRKWLK